MTEKPMRIQRRRTKGSKLPPNTMIVDRSTEYGNPYKVGTIGVPTAELAVKTFVSNLPLKILPSFLEPLRGQNLACWCRLCDAHKDGKPLGVECKDCEPCHADVLLYLANPQPIEAEMCDGLRKR